MQTPSNKPAHLHYSLRSSDAPLLQPLSSERDLRRRFKQTSTMSTASTSSTASTAASTTASTSAAIASGIQAMAKVSESTGLSPPVFTGSGDPHFWIRYFKSYIKFRKYADADALAIFELLMRDEAHTWFIQLSDEIKATFKNVEKEFLKRFAHRDCQQWQLVGDLFSRQQGPKETVDTYVEAMQRDFTQAHIEDATVLLHAVIRGLRPHIRYAVLQANCKTILD